MDYLKLGRHDVRTGQPSPDTSAEWSEECHVEEEKWPLHTQV